MDNTIYGQLNKVDIPFCLHSFRQLKACLSEMDFSRLPGLDSQLAMAPMHRYSDIISRGEGRSATKSAVLLLIYPTKENKPCIVFIQRPEYAGVHSGQISFPGGRYEDFDHDLQETALRETFEEIGVMPAAVNVVGKITDLFIPPSNFIVSPYVGISDRRPDFSIDENEVMHLIEIELDMFYDGACRQIKEIPLLDGRQISTPCYQVHGHMIWGATAMMLSEFLTMLRLYE